MTIILRGCHVHGAVCQVQTLLGSAGVAPAGAVRQDLKGLRQSVLI